MMIQGEYNVADTETTGLDFAKDRLVEIGVIKMRGTVEIGRFHEIIDPGMRIPADSTRIHGITDAMVEGKPKFAALAERFLAFIGDAPLVIHNAPFDMRFLNKELADADLPALHNEVVDTADMSRARFPGQQLNLDALVKRFGLENLRAGADGLHGALIDARMLVGVYIELCGGRQGALVLKERESDADGITGTGERRPGVVVKASQAELERHASFIGKLKNPVWSAAA